MAYYYTEPSRSFSEYLLIPGYTDENCIPDRVQLQTPLVRYRKGEEKCPLMLNIPLTSAIMQSVSDDTLAVALAKEGGLSFIYDSQAIDTQAAMVARVKAAKAGFVVSASNLTPRHTLADVLNLQASNGFSTIAVTDDGTATGRLEGIVTSRDYRVSRMSPVEPIANFMTPMARLITAPLGTTLSQANDIIWEHKLNSLPIVDGDGKLCYFVFRKDYASHKANPQELLDEEKRFLVGAGINTQDYQQRIPALLEAGADVLCIDSSDGFTHRQAKILSWVRQNYGTAVKIGAGNVVDRDGFLFLANAGADFVKVGMSSSMHTARESTGLGRGQATAVIEVAAAREEYFRQTGIYVPICSDGGIIHDHHMTLALAMGADFMMLGRYFARFDEAPTKMVMIDGSYMKEYWGEGSNRAQNWQRYDLGGSARRSFEAGVSTYVAYAGSLRNNVESSLHKIRSTMCNCGCMTIEQLQKDARLTPVSPISLAEANDHEPPRPRKK